MLCFISAIYCDYTSHHAHILHCRASSKDLCICYDNHMSGFEEKYGIEETDDVKNFHRSRRMFAIHHDTLYIAEENADYSHAEWFKRLGWMDESNDSIMDVIVRGYIKEQTIFFYVGYDFSVNDTAVKIMHHHVPDLAGRLKLGDDTQIMAGVILNSDGTAIERMQLGRLAEFIARTDL